MLQANESITLQPSFHAKAGSGFHAKWTTASNTGEEISEFAYEYDAIGNLTHDRGEGTNITWTPYGKVRTVSKGDGTAVSYQYDAAGNRISKRVTSNNQTKTTHYVRDASGNVLSIYQDEALQEQPIYGSSRLGMYRPTASKADGSLLLGQRNYELSNHLGNVLSVITDEVKINTDGLHEPVILQTQDYRPFGLAMEGRSWQSDSYSYRFSFNGKEKVDEVSGKENTVDMGDRWLDTRLGRTPKPDAKASKYPALSPYSYAANNPIFFVDPDGKVIKVHYVENGVSKYYTYTPGIKPTTSNTFVQQVHEAVIEVMKNDANKTFQNLSVSKETITFNEIKTNDDATNFSFNAAGTKVENVSINWNPTVGLKTRNGEAFAPATALLHEAGHGERLINTDTETEIDALKNDAAPNGTNYDNNEEKRVVDNIETPYINITNKNQPFNIMVTPQQQGTRTNHRGTPYNTTGANSITPADGTTIAGQSQPLETTKKMIVPTDNTRVAKPILLIK